MGAKAKAKRERVLAAEPQTAAATGISRFARIERHPATFLLASVVILVPCFWQSRLQAGDLSSHIYNAWLAQLAGKGQAPGLAIVPQTTNVLFDLLLSALFRAFGAAAAQRIAVALAVLVFFWGTFTFVNVTSRGAWKVAPALAALTYGWVFHIGFFNFYLSLGLCFLALALVWDAPPIRLAAAIPLLGLAYVAHALAVAWAVAVLIYAWLWRGVPVRFRRHLFLIALGGLLLLCGGIWATMRTHWFSTQFWRATGADQLWVYGSKYTWAAGALAAIWVWIGAERWRRAPVCPAGPLLPIGVLTSVGILAIPTVIWIPPYNHQLSFISDRMSLALAILVCGLVAGSRVRGLQSGAMGVAAVLFFGCLYADERVLNNFEDQVDQVISQLPPRQPVVLSLIDEEVRVNAITHAIDRACIGRCWSYGNYEPSSGQFRLRVAGDTTLAARTNADANGFQNGRYVVQPRDLPLYQILIDEEGRLVVRQAPVGHPIGVLPWSGL